MFRLMLGIGESVMFPACSKICATHLPEEARGFANGLIIAAIRWGSAVGTFGGGMLIAHYGWRKAFIGIGLVSLLWLPAWARWKPKLVAAKRQVSERAPSFVAILRQRSFWGCAVGHFCGNYILYFLISWLPYYLVNERHLSMTSMASTAGLLYATDSIASLFTGWLTDRCIKGGCSVTAARKWAMGTGFAIAAVALGACALAGPHTYLWCLAGVAVGSGVGNSGNFAFPQTLAGPHAVGKWVGLQNGFANLSGVAGPALTGFLIDATGHFGIALAIAAFLMVVGGAGWVLGVEKVEQVEFS